MNLPTIQGIIDRRMLINYRIDPGVLRRRVEPLSLERVESSFFDDRLRFPDGSIDLDCGLLMRGIEHQWHAREPICCRAVGTSVTSGNH